METRNKPTVQLIDKMGSDDRIVEAARVLHPGHARIWKNSETAGVINYMMEHRHGSPFEHGVMTFYAETPIAICREFERHRIGFSFQDEISLNVESGRYSELSDEFYTLDVHSRPVQKAEDFKHSRPELTTNPELATRANVILRDSYTIAWTNYQALLDDGVPREVARFVLPVGIFTRLYVTCNVRAMCHFLSLRTMDKSAKIKSYPQWEIQQVAALLEKQFAELFPLCHAAFHSNGRIGP